MIVAAALLLAGCAGTPTWIEAPLVADGRSVDEHFDSYRGFDAEIVIDDASTAYFRFSTLTLPGPNTAEFDKESKRFSPSDYKLDESKVHSARLVFFVEEVQQPGTVLIYQGMYLGGKKPYICDWKEAYAPPCSSTPNIYTGLDPDFPNPNAPVVIKERGFYSFNVTEAVKASIRAAHPAVVLSVRSPDGLFRIASKDKQVKPYVIERGAQLLITLTDQLGGVFLADKTNNIQQAQPDQSFLNQSELFVRGGDDDQAVALLSTRRSGSQSGQLALGKGGDRVQLTLVSRVNRPLQEMATIDGQDPALRFFSLGGHDRSAATWNNTTLPPIDTSTILPTTPLDLDPKTLNQIALTDATSTLTRFIVDNMNNTVSKPFWIGAATNAIHPIRLDGSTDKWGLSSRADAAHPNRLIYSAKRVWDYRDQGRHSWQVWVHDHDSLEPIDIAKGFEARIGQQFEFLYVGIKAENGRNLSMPVHIVAPPPDQASAVLDWHDFNEPDYGGNQKSSSSFPVGARANHIVGSYSIVASMSGHNDRLRFPLTNLPLPLPSLDGPSAVAFPLGVSSVTVPADAATPFTLRVDDAVVNKHIDDTTKWRFTSSNPADTLPGQIQQTHGSVNFAVTFASRGPRTLKVTSVGDAAVTATLDVNVIVPTQVAIEASALDLTYGQALTLQAPVTAPGAQPPPGTVSFYDGATLLATVPAGNSAVIPSAVVPTPLARGVHRFSARYSGDVDAGLGASVSSTIDVSIKAAATRTTLTPPPVFVGGVPAMVRAAVAVVAPGAGVPAGTVTIADGHGASCSYSVPAASGCALTLPGAGTATAVTIKATFLPADSNYTPSSASASSSIVTAVRSFNGTTVPHDPSDAGPASADFSGGGQACRFDPDNTGFIAAPAAPPEGKTLPQGMFKFKLIGCEPGSTVDMVVQWPQAVAGYAKWGRKHADAAPSWFTPAGPGGQGEPAIEGGKVSFSITDGGPGDDDGLANGVIVDPTGPTRDVGSPDEPGDTRRSQTLSFAAQVPASRVFETGTTFSINPPASSAEPNSGQPIRYSSLTAGVCTVFGTSVTMVSAGSCTIAADQAGDDNYAAATQVKQSVALNSHTSFSGTTVPPKGGTPGPATASFTGGGSRCGFDSAVTAFIAAPAAPPEGKTLPQGMFKFKLIGCEPASTITMRIAWPQAPSGYTKYGKASKDAAASSYFEPNGLAIDGHTVSFTVPDGQKGDDDWSENGQIVDPSGPLADAPPPVAQVTPIPTLGEWGLMLLGLLAAGLGVHRLRRV